jgi:hypothetical protein
MSFPYAAAARTIHQFCVSDKMKSAAICLYSNQTWVAFDAWSTFARYLGLVKPGQIEVKDGQT